MRIESDAADSGSTIHPATTIAHVLVATSFIAHDIAIAMSRQAVASAATSAAASAANNGEQDDQEMTDAQAVQVSMHTCACHWWTSVA
jgi:Flp pilus assembly protein TadG